MAYAGSFPLPIAHGNTGISTNTAYGLLLGGTTSTGNIQNLGTGISGQNLISSGSGAKPFFATGGALVFLQSKSASNSTSLSFTSFITSAYNTYLFVFSNIVTTGNGQPLTCLVSENGGSSYISSGYLSCVNCNESYNSSSLNNANSTVQIRIGRAQRDTAVGLSGKMYFYNVTSGKQVSWVGSYVNTDNTSTTTGFGTNAGTCTATSVNAFQFTYNSVNMSSGIISLFGIVE